MSKLKDKPLTPPDKVIKVFNGKPIKNFETTMSRLEKIEKEARLTKEEAVEIAKTYVHQSVSYTPQTIKDNKHDIIGKFLPSVEKLMK